MKDLSINGYNLNVHPRQLNPLESIQAPSTLTALPPVARVDFSTPQINAFNANVHPNAAFYNEFYGNSWVLHYSNFSYLEVETEFKKLDNRSYSLDLLHLSSLVNGQPLSRITIEVNGQIVVTDHNPNNGNYTKESFDITDYLQDGKNSIKISLDGDSQSNYWIQSLAIQAH